MTTTKPGILVDIDGVLADCDGPLYKILAEKGYPLDRAACDHYGATTEQLSELYGLAPDAALELVASIWWGEGFMLAQPPRLDGIQGFRQLAGLGEPIHIVTARNTERGPFVAAETKAWLERHGMGWAPLYFEGDKVEHLRRHKLRYIVEDAPHTAEKAWLKGYGVILVDQTYNRHVEARDRLWRVESVNQAAELIAADWEARS